MNFEGEPHKKYKKDGDSQQIHSKPSCNFNGEEEIREICGALLSIQNYTKYISVIIRHHETSIETLPAVILQDPHYEELSQRVDKCIGMAKINR